MIAARNEPIHAETKDCCHVCGHCQILHRPFMLHLAYKTNCYQRGTSIPSNKGELVREPVKGQIKPSYISDNSSQKLPLKAYHVHVLCSTGVGSRSLLLHFSSPIGT